MADLKKPLPRNVEHLVTESIEKSRRLSYELSPAILQHAGLAGAEAFVSKTASSGELLKAIYGMAATG